MEVIKEIEKLIGVAQTEKFIQLLKNNYLEFEDGYINHEYYTSYEDEEYINNFIQKNYYNYKNIQDLTYAVLDLYYENEVNYWEECFRADIKENIYKLDISENKSDALIDYMIDHYSINYENVINLIQYINININIDLCNEYGESGHLFIKKYLPKNLYNTLRKMKNDYFYYSYTLSSILNINILDYYNKFKDKNRINLKGTFVIKDGFNGRYQDDYLTDKIIIDLKNVAIKNIHDVGYTIEEISGENDFYICELVEGDA